MNKKKKIGMFLVVFSLASLLILDITLILNSFLNFMNPFGTLKILVINLVLGLISFISRLYVQSL